MAPGSLIRVTGNWQIGPITNVDDCQACSYVVILVAGGTKLPLVIKTSPALNPALGESGAIDWTGRVVAPSGITSTVGAVYALGDKFDENAAIVGAFGWVPGFGPPGNFLSGGVDVRGPSASPQISGTLGTNGWYTTDIGVNWQVNEVDGYPVLNKTGCDAVTISTDGAGQALSCSLTSKSGTGSFPLKINRDATKPTLAPIVPPTVDLGAVVSATPNASDALSGLASATCDPVVTNVAGTHSVQCSATDKAGNTATKSVDYVVLSPYQFGGFQSPIDGTKTNSINAGKAVPVKFSLGGNKGLAIFAAGSPTSRPFACSASAPVSTILETAAATSGGSALSYDSQSDTYTYVWKTEKSWAGTCRTFVLKLTDGVERTVQFEFKK